jgi:hypothetical protein
MSTEYLPTSGAPESRRRWNGWEWLRLNELGFGETRGYIRLPKLSAPDAGVSQDVG